MKHFTIPADFKLSTIDRYDELNKKYEDSKVIETYGQLAPESLFGSGRSPKDLPRVDRQLLEQYVQYSNDKGIDFNYTLNATTLSNDELTREGFQKIKGFLLMLQDIGVKGITISLPSVIEITKEIAPNLQIKTSTLSQINSPIKAKYYDKLGINRIVLDEDINRRFDVLKEIRDSYSGEIEVIINSFCITDCPLRMFHFNSFSHSNTDKDVYPYFSARCMELHVNKESYMKLNWIRPEDLHYYMELGINHFKLQGRTSAYHGDPVKTVAHYMEERYEGDLISLLELFSSAKPFTISGASVDNRKLDGFFDKFVKYPNFCTKNCDRCGYCDSYSNRSTDTLYRLYSEEEMRKLILEEYLQELNK